jgi:hypothetical protein
MAGLAEAVQGTVGQPASVRIGTVDSVAPPIVSAQGVPFDGIGFLRDYNPQIGDTVALLGQSSNAGSDPASWLVLGAVAGTTGAVVAQLRQTVAQSIPSGGAPTPLVFNVADEDTAGGWSESILSRWVAPVSGRYQVSGGGSFAPAAGGVRTLQFLVNGVEVPGSGTLDVGSAAGGGNRLAARTMTVPLNAGDYLELGAFQNLGAPLLTAVGGVEQATLSVWLI